jgi:hypothetical protein
VIDLLRFLEPFLVRPSAFFNSNSLGTFLTALSKLPEVNALSYIDKITPILFPVLSFFARTNAGIILGSRVFQFALKHAVFDSRTEQLVQQLVSPDTAPQIAQIVWEKPVFARLLLNQPQAIFTLSQHLFQVNSPANVDLFFTSGCPSLRFASFLFSAIRCME